jgi:hypothetical protein
MMKQGQLVDLADVEDVATHHETLINRPKQVL